MFLGNKNSLVKKFYRYEQKMHKCILEEWDQIKGKVKKSDLEKNISKRLLWALLNNNEVRSVGLPIIEYVLLGEDKKGDPVTKGIIDIAVLIVDEYRAPDTYIAYECKRLNVKTNGNWKSLSGVYSTEGVKRYVSAKYAEKLPLGCMIGYVMDGDIKKAHDKIIDSISARQEDLGLNSMIETTNKARFSSLHNQGKSLSEIEVIHSLLPV